MSIDADGFAKLLDRFGLPTLFIAVLALLAYKLIQGPAMVLAAKMGDGFGVLAKSGSEFLARLTASMEQTHLEHSDLRSHTSSGVAELKATIAAESSATREHVTSKVESWRDRVSAAENMIENTVRTSAADYGPQSAASTPRATAPTLPEGHATCAR